MGKKRIILDGTVEGEVEIQDSEGKTPLFLSIEEMKTLLYLLIKCKKCSTFKRAKGTLDLNFLIDRVKYTLERIDV